MRDGRLAFGIVPIHARRVLDVGGGTQVDWTLLCPEAGQAIALERCLCCGRSGGVWSDPLSGRRYQRCRADGPTRRSSDASDRGVAGTLTALVTEAMVDEVYAVRRDVEIGSIRELLLSRGISGVPVVDPDGFPIGIVSKTDLVRGGDRSGQAAPDRLPAGDLMTDVVFSLPENATLLDAATMMVVEQVHRVAIVDGAGILSGVLSTLDILRWLVGRHCRQHH